MYDMGLGYDNAFYLIAAWCIGGGALLAFMKRPRRAAAVGAAAMPGSGV
jgi:hypothetical protein